MTRLCRSKTQNLFSLPLMIFLCLEAAGDVMSESYLVMSLTEMTVPSSRSWSSGTATYWQ
jgi:hypothetical protein